MLYKTESGNVYQPVEKLLVNISFHGNYQLLFPEGHVVTYKDRQTFEAALEDGSCPFFIIKIEDFLKKEWK